MDNTQSLVIGRLKMLERLFGRGLTDIVQLMFFTIIIPLVSSDNGRFEYIYGSLLKGDFSKSEKFNLALLSYLLMDFDLVFGKLREMMRRDKPYQKELVLITNY